MTNAIKGNRQWRRTRAALLAAGEQLFADRPVDGVTVDQIVMAADVGKGSFYNHFEDKDALARAIHDRVQEDVESGVRACNASITDPAQRIVRGFCWFVAYARSHPHRLQTIMRLADERTFAQSPLNVQLAAEMQNGIDKGSLYGVDIQTAVLVMSGLSRATLVHLTGDGKDQSAQGVAASVGHALLRALGIADQEAKEIAREAAREIVLSQPNGVSALEPR